MLQFHSPGYPGFKADWPTKLGWKKLVQMLPHFENGSVRKWLTEIMEQEGVPMPTHEEGATLATADQVQQAVDRAEHEDADGVIDESVPF